MNLDKESKTRILFYFFYFFFFFGGGGGGGGGLGESMSFLYGTHRQDLFVTTVKYYDNVPKDMNLHLKPSRGNNSESM